MFLFVDPFGQPPFCNIFATSVDGAAPAIGSELMDDISCTDLSTVIT